jgi:hypothetical protein
LLIFRIFTVAVIAMTGIYLYLNKFDVKLEYFIWAGAAVVTTWMLVIFRIKYL